MTHQVSDVIVEDADYDSIQEILDTLKKKGITDLSNVRINHERDYGFGETYHRVEVVHYREETEQEKQERLAEQERRQAESEARQRKQYEELREKFENS